MTDRCDRDDASGAELVAGDDSIIGRVFRWSILLVVITGAAAFAIRWGLRSSGPGGPPRAMETAVPKTPRAPDEVVKVSFTDITREAGIDFIHVNGARGDKLLPETMGGGAAFLDFDSDGDQDILLINSKHWPDHEPSPEVQPVAGLYRNDGRGRFENVTTDSGLDVSLYGMGVAVGDYDNDGWVDVFITAVGANHLFHNVGGRFENVTSTAGVAGDPEEWSSSTGFLDYDRDGDLDLFVCNYVRWSKEIDFAVDNRFAGVGRAYGPPTNFEGTYPYLYRNDGDGRFMDVTETAGLWINNPATGRPMGKALGVVPIDADGDGWLDLFVANDTVRNHLFHNQGDGTFVERGVEFGLAFDRNGNATGAMGVDAGRYRNDDSLGLFIGNFANEMTTLYVSQGIASLYADEAIAEGIGSPSRLMLTFGLFLFDYDLDGRLDLLQVNGHLEEQINLIQPSQHYEQPAQLFRNCGSRRRGCFVAVAAEHTGDLGKPIVGRGAAYADIDGDGDLDVLLTQVGRRPRLLRNDQTLGHHWLRVKLVGRSVNRDAIGAWIELEVDATTQVRQVMPTRSYLSQMELPVTFGLGLADHVDRLRIRWTDGSQQSLVDLPVDRLIVVEQAPADSPSEARPTP